MRWKGRGEEDPASLSLRPSRTLLLFVLFAVWLTPTSVGIFFLPL